MRGRNSREVAAPEPVRLRSLLWTVFVPMAVYGIGTGAAVPMYPLRALDLGVSAGTAGAVVALSGVGMVLMDLPAGRVVTRIGERGAMVVGSVLGAAGVLAAIVAPDVRVLALGMLLTGAAGAVWGLARQSYLVSAVLPADLGRALSTLAGATRLGFFCGPFLGAAIVHTLGPNGALWLQLATTVLAGAAIASIRSLDAPAPGAGPASLGTVLLDHRRVLGTLGSAALLVGASRAARQALLPLWAAQIGVSASTVSLVFGMAGAVDVLLSYPSGVWLDRYGRKATGVPSMLLFAFGFGLLPFASSVAALSASAMLLGLGNGLSNGLIMTVGADVAPAEQRAEFLGAWRLTHDLGAVVGPLAVGVIGACAPLAAASAVLALAAATGAGAMRRWFPGRVGPPASAPGRLART